MEINGIYFAKGEFYLYFEDTTPNYFRQHITDLKNKLLRE